MRKEIDALTIEYTELSTELCGISKKLSLYSKIELRREKIRKRIEELGGTVSYTKIAKTNKGRGNSKKYINKRYF